MSSISLLQAADFGPRTALKVVDGVRDKIMGGQLKTGDAIRAELKVGCLQKERPLQLLAAAILQGPALLTRGCNGWWAGEEVLQPSHRWVAAFSCNRCLV